MKLRIRSAAILLVFAALLCLCAACGQTTQAENPPKYTLYCGLLDADAGTQVLTLEEAQELARAIILENGCGYTEFVTHGAYMSEGAVISNDTLVYEFYFADAALIEQVAAQIQTELNILPILTAEGTTIYQFTE